MRNRLLPILFLLSTAASAQISEGGRPLALQKGFAPSQTIETVQLPAIDRNKALQDDAANPEYARFAAPVQVDVSGLNAGAWTPLADGGHVWQCAVQSADALGLILIFDAFSLPQGARLFAYSPDGATIKGAYTQKSNTPTGKFTIGIVHGDKAILEYYAPPSAPLETPFHLNRVDVAYDKIDMISAPEFDFGESLPCHININCPTGSDFQTEKKGVARILMVFSNGSGWCSGSMIANTGNTAEPYFLTAHHCQLIGTSPDFDLWVFDFDYEAVGCSNPGAEPTAKSVLGCQRISYRAETDFMLLKLNPIPPTYGVYFNGWDRSSSAPTKSTFVHHPVGDIKKITKDTQPAVLFPLQLNWGGVFGSSPANTHWKILPDLGTYQGGSSGSPLFNQNKKIVGQFHGGSVNNLDPCIVTGAYFGLFSLSWNAGNSADSRLKDWLDLTNTNAMSQNGYWQPAPTTVSISGNVQTHWGTAMVGVSVILSGSASDTATTDVSGNFSFTSLPAGGNFTVTPVRDGNDINGLTTYDLVLTSKHLLGLEPLDTPWKIIAADANKSNSVTTFDVVEGRKIILGINNEFPSNTSWRFFPADQNFPDPSNPFSGTVLSESIYLENLNQNISNIYFKGVKIGDTNNSADAGQ